MGTQLNRSITNETGTPNLNITHTRKETIKAKQEVTLTHKQTWTKTRDPGTGDKGT